MTWVEFFSARLAHIYLVYGLAFFILGVAVALEIWRARPTRFSRALPPLAVFGLVHGSHEWLEMFTIVGRETYNYQPSIGLGILGLIFLSVSFAALIAFGVQMLRPPKRLRHSSLWIGFGILALYGLGIAALAQWVPWRQPAWFAAADALARYAMAIPGAILAAWALLARRQNFLKLKQPAFANDLLWAALAFLLYGVVGQFFVGPAPFFPSNVINSLTFLDWFGIPIQLFRAVMAVFIAVFTIRAARSFEFNRRQELAAVRHRVAEEIAQRDTLRQEFLQQIVATQEEERTRIARELHDELGQALTGLAIGLRGVQSSIDKPDLLKQQLSQLEATAVQALGDMRHLITELRPAILDDMGLEAALRHYCNDFTNLTGIKTNLTICDDYARLSDNIETALFRITQESLTNTARHAQATQASIALGCSENETTLVISDNGLGFDPGADANGKSRRSWGLIGIQERARLVGGEAKIESEPGSGTTLLITVPLKGINNYQLSIINDK